MLELPVVFSLPTYLPLSASNCLRPALLLLPSYTPFFFPRRDR